MLQTDESQRRLGDGRVRIFAAAEVHVLLFEPASTLNTGNVRDGRPLDILERI